MIRVQFMDSSAVHTVEFEATEETVRLTGETLTENHSGFLAYRLNGAMLGNYSTYTECVKCEGGYEFQEGGTT